MSPSQKQQMLDAKTIVSMMADFGIHECDEHILQYLLKFNKKRITLILEKAKLYARLANKNIIDNNDVQVVLQKAKDATIPEFSPSGNKEQDIHIIEISDYESINREVYNKILAQFDQKSDDILPVITDSDLEEVFRSINDNQHMVTEKTFDVGSLLHDPHSL